ncbi:succinyl-diaminopimelate desuccinylase [Gammaproteobacteria bacterium]|nr:succinyl-diaminopimelate desuccinylase [Gammaproteobacteria bacterium]
MSASEVQVLAKRLIACPSITPNDAGCQVIVQNFLKPLGFQIQTLTCGPVTNMIAIRAGKKPSLAFLGHTDVVPPGPLEAWHNPPFTPTTDQHFLFGRGACDMKAAIAAMLIALKSLLTSQPNFDHQLLFLLTSDEEGVAEDGTRRIMQYLKQKNWIMDACLIGEPTANNRVGDTIKQARRGSINGVITVQGKQGHAAYPFQADSPIQSAAQILTLFQGLQFDQATPPSECQITKIETSDGATNVIPSTTSIQFNIRYHAPLTANQIINQLRDKLTDLKHAYLLTWQVNAKPFHSNSGKLYQAATQAIQDTTHHTPCLSCEGGTSDGRFVHPYGPEILELGLCNHTAHQINEHISLKDLDDLVAIYRHILTYYFSNKKAN